MLIFPPTTQSNLLSCSFIPYTNWVCALQQKYRNLDRKTAPNGPRLGLNWLKLKKYSSLLTKQYSALEARNLINKETGVCQFQFRGRSQCVIFDLFLITSLFQIRIQYVWRGHSSLWHWVKSGPWTKSSWLQKQLSLKSISGIFFFSNTATIYYWDYVKCRRVRLQMLEVNEAKRNQPIRPHLHVLNGFLKHHCVIALSEPWLETRGSPLLHSEGTQRCRGLHFTTHFTNFERILQARYFVKLPGVREAKTFHLSSFDWGRPCVDKNLFALAKGITFKAANHHSGDLWNHQASPSVMGFIPFHQASLAYADMPDCQCASVKEFTLDKLL